MPHVYACSVKFQFIELLPLISTDVLHPPEVRVFGPGLEHGVLWNFQSHFFVDARQAGQGDLTVRVRGARGKQNDWIDLYLHKRVLGREMPSAIRDCDIVCLAMDF